MGNLNRSIMSKEIESVVKKKSLPLEKNKKRKEGRK
jgi:hypothetical protein